MNEWHEYSPKNVSFCQECKDIHDKCKDEECQIDDYHKIVPLGEETFANSYNIPEVKKSKKRAYDASLLDLARGKNIRFKKDYQGNSQKHAYEVYDDDEDEDLDNEDESNENKNGGKRKRKTRRKKIINKRKTNRKKKYSKRRRTLKKR